MVQLWLIPQSFCSLPNTSQILFLFLSPLALKDSIFASFLSVSKLYQSLKRCKLLAQDRDQIRAEKQEELFLMPP